MWTAQEQLEGDEADRRQQRGDERATSRRRRWMAMTAATAQAATRATPFGRVAVARAASDAGEQPALVEQEPEARPRRARSAAPRRRRSDSTNEPGNTANSTIARSATSVVEEPPGEHADEHHGARPTARS